MWNMKKKKNERKTRCKSKDIDENNIVQWLGKTFGIIRRLAAEWRRIRFYDVIGNMAGSNKRCSRGDSSNRTQEKGVLKKTINGNVPSEVVSLWFASVYGAAASSIQNCVWPLVLRLKKYKNGNFACKAYLCLTSHPVAHMLRRSDNFVSGISGNYQK